MILLSGHSLTPARKVMLEKHSIKLTERDSTASIIPADMDGITTESWMRDEKDPGAGIVWRVKRIDSIFGGRQTQVELEHLIGILKDRILFGAVTPADIAGGSATTCTAKQAVEYILGQQSDWTLGTFGYSVSNPYKFDGDSLYDALEKVSNTLSDAFWTYDFSTYPFILNINPAPSGVACELRPGRNLTALTKTVDKSGMYTRFYPIGKDDLHVPGGYISRNENLYGVISHVEVDQTLETVAELTAWANERLDRHAVPNVSITADGLELADATGESLDRLKLGRLCRIPLKEFSTVIEERIVELSYPDKLFAPETVKVTMANQRQDISRIVADAIKKAAGGGGGRADARQKKEDHAWFEDTNEHVAMCAEGIVGVDAQGNPNWVLLSQIIVDGTGVHQHVTEVQNGLALTDAGLEIEAGKIAMVVGTYNDQNYIKAGEIVLAINAAGESEAHIDANKVYIGNDKSTTVIAGKLNVTDLTANLIQSKIAELSNLQANAVVINSSSGFISCGGTITGGGFILASSGGGQTSYTNLGTSVVGVDVQNNQLILTQANGDVTTFNKATSLSGAWSGNIWTVTASPQGNTISTTVEGSASYDSTEHRYNIYVFADSGTRFTGVTGREAWNAVTVDSITAPQGTSQTATLTATAANGKTGTETIAVTNSGFAGGGIYAQARIGGTNGTLIARQWIDLPASATWSSYWPASNVISVTCQVGGKSYTQSFTR